jgi:Flp pilus assembly protein TadB
MQEYENVASERERAYAWQNVRDSWYEGEKLQIEPQRQKHMEGLSPRTTIIVIMILVIVILVVLLGVLLFLLISIAFVHGSGGTFPGGPGPIQHTIPHP